MLSKKNSSSQHKTHIKHCVNKKKPIALKAIGFYLLNILYYLRVSNDCFAYPFSGSIASVLLKNSIAFSLSVLA